MTPQLNRQLMELGKQLGEKFGPLWPRSFRIRNYEFTFDIERDSVLGLGIVFEPHAFVVLFTCIVISLEWERR